jgi:hypothetical protein
MANLAQRLVFRHAQAEIIRAAQTIPADIADEDFSAVYEIIHKGID